ncbi:protein disulfide isomerase Creld2-like [Diadema antillarum]|uniref:protein disulfide isomerase Creld2-like n=1 Tax=Diadema antillarum TaxID=105358 RepID=UPI003A898AC9
MEVRLKLSWTTITLVVLELFLFLSLCNGGKKENELVKKKCDTCRSLTKSFKEGMERTSRYSYEGGDADWEEKKLGSYATSEMRFIEVTEGLCENKEHDCHNLLETQEELIETWWKEYQEEYPDMFQWFCIDNYKVCCQENRFGPECEECPYGLERPCKGNGKCMGAGTRAGTGKCKCNAGYKGDLCDICKDGYYEVMKNEMHTACKACHKACTALCTGPGPKGCKKCKAGWLWSDEEGCQDVDECKAEEQPCEPEEFCENTQGSFKCVVCDKACDQCLGEGSDHCVKCKSGYAMDDDRQCLDINECDKEDACKIEHMTCHNVPGSFYCDCEDGYERVGNECMDRETFEANNETDHSSEESSEKLESATGEEGEVETSGTSRGIANDESTPSEEFSGRHENVDDESDKILQNGDDDREKGHEIPSSLDDLQDVLPQGLENPTHSDAFADMESQQLTEKIGKEGNLQTSQTADSHVEL